MDSLGRVKRAHTTAIDNYGRNDQKSGAERADSHEGNQASHQFGHKFKERDQINMMMGRNNNPERFGGGGG